MSAISLANFKLLVRGMLGHAEDSTGGVADKVNRAWQRVAILQVPTDADGDFTIAPESLFRAPQNLTILSAYYICAATGITANGTNYTTLKLNKTDGAGGSQVITASYASDVAGGSTTALVPKALTLSATLANRDLDAGNILGVVGTKTSAGVAVPAGVMVVYYTER